MSGKRLFIFGLILCLLACVPACNPPAPEKITLEPCLVGSSLARCGTLSVFENRANRQGRKIDIHVAVVPARDGHPAPDPIFYLAGGPGGSAIDDAPYALQVLKSATVHRDLVLVDQRGTGRSNKLVCTLPLDQSMSVAPGGPTQVEALRACIAGLDADPAAYTTAWGMDDLDDVRAALGYEKINLYGESYGPIAEQIYLQRHGEHVRSVILEGVSLTDAKIFEHAPQNIQLALDQLFARCKADPGCNASYPNISEEFPALMQRLDQQPATLPMTDPISGQALVLTRAMLASGVFTLLRNTGSAVLLPHLIHQMYLGQWEEIAQAITKDYNPEQAGRDWQIMNLNILCNEDWASMRPSEIEKSSQGAYMRYEDIENLVAPASFCAVMPRPQAAALYQPITKSNVPVLLISNGADPMNPPENAASATAHYPNSVTLVAPGQGHGYDGIECRDPILAAFIESGAAQGLETACLQNLALPSFAP